MSPYTRPQLWMLLALIALGGLGVAAGSWRRAHPELIDRIERFDAGSVVEPSIPPRQTSTPTEAAAPGPLADVATGGATSGPASAPVVGSGRPRESDGASETGFAAVPVNLNRATAQELERLPGIGPALADRIVATRERTGPFEAIDDLRRVAGVGRVKLDRLRPLVTVAD